jgi:hypothetical protein
MATVKLSSLPSGVHAGQPWNVRVSVLQHGRTPMSDATPRVTIQRAGGGKKITFSTKRTSRVGVYSARVVFPAAGAWRYSVWDGFPVRECARTHTFPRVTIDPPL